ncbi:hypothetical protein B0H17DRAFT_1134150 [Mycena rosella]|uniref:Uncharacterized protein n=1 Tax=Mycena rosella TaxID=1033263 RepID=A0AAD7GHB5_MYCRO|nr:hypothetical protein B0H17DRAFT_1134150 [Mycena rosella]
MSDARPHQYRGHVHISHGFFWYLVAFFGSIWPISAWIKDKCRYQLADVKMGCITITSAIINRSLTRCSSFKSDPMTDCDSIWDVPLRRKLNYAAGEFCNYPPLLHSLRAVNPGIMWLKKSLNVVYILTAAQDPQTAVESSV